MNDPPADPPTTGIKGRLWRWIAAHSDTRLVRTTREAGRVALRYLHAENHDPLTNGEAVLLRALSASAHVIFDVGANYGAWALLAADSCPNAHIYCFEIAASTRQRLEQIGLTQPRIHLARTGLWDHAGTIPTKQYLAEPAWTSVFDFPHDALAAWVEEPVITGDAAIEELGVRTIDLLKLDVEGAELNILNGFASALQEHRIRTIQFEYGYAALYSHGLLRDFYALLEPLGYTIGRLHATGADLAPYTIHSETFFGPNYVAIAGTEQELLSRLARGDQDHHRD